MPLVLLVPSLVVEEAALALALAALERTVKVGMATVAVDIPDLPELSSHPLSPLLLVRVIGADAYGQAFFRCPIIPHL